ncbi:effector protein [Pseudomonas oryzihabitans]|nr:effector protein [Pseudomonas psychrotolerans]
MGFIERKLIFLRQTFSYVGWSVFWLLLWDIAVTVDYMIFVDHRAQLPSIPLTLIGSALIVLTSFRNTSAYQRWWEARTLWGGMVNSSRSFGRQVLTLIDDGDERFNSIKTVLIERHLAYVRCLACQLSGDSLPKEVKNYLGKEEWAMRKETNNFANAILSGSANLIAIEYRARRLDSIRLERLEATFVDMSNWQGGMERIANTPLPYPYVNFPRLFIFLFCVLMPIGLVESLEWYTPLASTVVGFMFLALEKVGTDLQSPFQRSRHQITMGTICSTIEGNLRTMLRDARSGYASVSEIVQDCRALSDEKESS